MKIKMAAIAMTGAALFTCTSAWSWYMKGDAVHFNTSEWNFCKLGATDAAAIMYSRQMSKPLWYPDDEHFPPTAVQKKIRIKFIQLAETYPVESTEEKGMAVADQFSKDMQRGCLQYIKLSRPELFAE